MVSSHNGVLVTLSILIAVAASYTALDIAQRVRESSTRISRTAWLAAAALCMGGGIWSMHFVAMLAYTMPGIVISYDPLLTALSLLIAILVTGGGFALVSRREESGLALCLGGLFMGAGIVAMHYIGMSAMRMPAHMTYSLTWVVVSILIALGAAVAALWLAFRGSRTLHQGAAAGAMGFAISGMHFAGMKAAHLHASEEPAGLVWSTFSQGGLAVGIALVTLMILLAAVVAAMFDRRFAALAQKEALSLREGEERFRQLYRGTPLPLHALDDQGHIQEVSDAWLTLLKLSRTEIYGRPFTAFMTEDAAAQRMREDWPALLAQGELKDRPSRLVAADGRILDVLISSRIERLRAEDSPRVIEGLIDLTERKATEEALRQAQKMEAIGQLTGGVAHDFNNLLTVIIGSLERARKKMVEDEALLRLLGNALEAAQRGASLTQRLLAFARKQNLDPQVIDVKSLVGSLQPLLNSSLPANISLKTDVPAGTPPIKVDPHQLEMALLNLVVNARDAMPEGGTITVATSVDEQPPSALAGGRYICLSVTDEGEGMDVETLSKARDPFFTTKGVGKGTGLGLPMVAGFAEQTGGLMVLKSELGSGTIVQIWLPQEQEGGEQLIERIDGGDNNWPVDLRDQVILAVDDDALVLMNTEAMLEDLGARVIATTSPLEALELIKTRPDITCVVSDYAMPKMTGGQLLEESRVQRPDLPFVIATGYNEAPVSAPATTLLVKPFTDQALHLAIREVCSRRADSLNPSLPAGAISRQLSPS